MTSDEVYKLIEANGLTLHGDIEHFAALVASAEREEILAFASSEAFNRQYGERSPFAYELEKEIRARGDKHD